jgi:hypothetical protein
MRKNKVEFEYLAQIAYASFYDYDARNCGRAKERKKKGSEMSNQIK